MKAFPGPDKPVLFFRHQVFMGINKLYKYHIQGCIISVNHPCNRRLFRNPGLIGPVMKRNPITIIRIKNKIHQ